MARYIDADKLLNERTIFIQDEEGFDIAVVAVADIELAPTADVAEVKHEERKERKSAEKPQTRKVRGLRKRVCANARASKVL